MDGIADIRLPPTTRTPIPPEPARRTVAHARRLGKPITGDRPPPASPPADGRAGARDAPSGERAGAAELAPKPHEQRLERERRRQLELLRLAPGGANELARALGGVQPLRRRVRAQLLEPVDVDDGRLRAHRDHDEVAVPPLELLERREQLVPLGAAL